MRCQRRNVLVGLPMGGLLSNLSSVSMSIVLLTQISEHSAGRRLGRAVVTRWLSRWSACLPTSCDELALPLPPAGLAKLIAHRAHLH